MKKEFNLIINGVGGQGLVTLIRIISQAAQDSGYDVKASELHGLSQRGGSVETHLRFGKKIWSPLVSMGQADLIISLEVQESLRGLLYASKDTVFLINKCKTPTLVKDLPEEDILKALNKITKNIHLVSASKVCQQELGKEVLSGIYLVGMAINKKVLPLKEKVIISAIKKTIPSKHLESNIKALKLSKKLNRFRIFNQ